MLCPICKRSVERAAPESPFCSDRCRLLDLGNWASGEYKVPLPDNGESALDGDTGLPALHQQNGGK